MSHRHASQHSRAQKQAGASPLVRSTGKDDPLFYALVTAAAQCPAREILFVGDRIDHDVAGPMRAGMQACLVRPGGLRPGEMLPGGVLQIGHVRDLPALVERA